MLDDEVIFKFPSNGIYVVSFNSPTTIFTYVFGQVNVEIKNSATI